MPRPTRVQIEGALCYITCRGDSEEKLFRDAEDYRTYLNLLSSARQRYSFKLFSFVLLPNHLHLLLEPAADQPLATVMHALDSSYTKYFNRRYRRTGHLFRERYRLVVAEKEPYLVPISAYIHKNPRALGLVERLEEYPYSSLPLYAGPSTSSGRTDGLDLTAEIRELTARLPAGAASSTLPAAPAANAEESRVSGASYMEYLDRLPAEAMEALGKELSKKTVLGSEEFAKRVEEKRLSAAEHRVATPKRRMRLAERALVAALGILAVGLLSRTVGLQQMFKQGMANLEAQLAERLARERTRIFNDLDEKYRADQVSLAAMTKRLEIEKGRVKELQEQIR